MEDNQVVYDTEEMYLDSKNCFRFYFNSKGKREIPKAVQYTYMGEVYNLPLYNFGFGDYDEVNDTIFDTPISCNEDHYKVFHTVLNTIPRMFEACQNAILSVRGSDSTMGFIKNCKSNCTRNCKNGECKKAHRRINIYRNFVDKYFNELNKEYLFFGHGPDKLEDYQKGKKYNGVVVMKKHLN